jgi:hypothetical protein
MSEDCHDSTNRSIATEIFQANGGYMALPEMPRSGARQTTALPDRWPGMSRELDAVYLGRFLGLAESALELQGKLTPEHFVLRMVQIAAEYRSQTGFPGALIETEGSTMRVHGEGHEAGK